jgi:hypothetical protein
MRLPPFFAPSAINMRSAIMALLALACLALATLHAQPVPQREPQGTREVQSDSMARDDDGCLLYPQVRLSGIAARYTVLPLTLTDHPYKTGIWSIDILLDLDLVTIRSTSDWMSSAMGLRLGAGIILWPLRNVSDYLFDKYGPVDMRDLDLLSRYSLFSSHYRLDFLLGLTVRSGFHQVKGASPWYDPPPMVDRRDKAMKIGVEASYAAGKPAVALHLRISGVLFGYETIEPGYLGIGISIGYQRYFQPTAQ